MTIIDKLNLNKYTNMAIVNQPNDYNVFTEQTTTLSKDHDAIFIFVETIDEMVTHTQLILNNEQLLLEKGYVFLAYPKKVTLVMKLLFTEMKYFQHFQQ